MTTVHHTASSVHVGTPSPGFQEWSRTNVYFHDFANLSAEKGRLVRSCSFECLGHNMWRVGMYPGGEEIDAIDAAADGGGTMASVVLCNRSGVDVLFGFGVKDGTGREVGGTSAHSLASGRRATISDFLKRSKIMKSLVDGTLVIEVRMKLADGPRTGPTDPPPPPRFAPENTRSMFADEESADMVIRVEEHWEESNSMDSIETASSSSAAAAFRGARRSGETSSGSATSGPAGEGGDGFPKQRGILRSRSRSRPHDHRNRADDRSKSRTRVAADDDGGVGERPPRGSRRDREREHPAPDPREQSPPHQECIRSVFVDEETADKLTRVEEYRGGGNAMNLAKTSSDTSHARRFGEKPSDVTSGPEENGVPKQGIFRSRSRSRPHDHNRADRSKSRTRVVADDDGGVGERPRGSQRDREREHPTPDRWEQSLPHQECIRSAFVDEETADKTTRVEEYRGEGNAIEQAKTSSDMFHARRFGEKSSDVTSGPGEDGFPKQQGILRSRSRSRPQDQNRVDRSKSRERQHPAPDRRENSPQRLRGESLRDYWRRRAEESKERVSRGSTTSSVGEEDTLGSGGRSLTSGGATATPSGKIVISK